MGNVVGRDDALYSRMKQRDLDGHDTMWEPIFMDDAAIGLGDQKNKVAQQPRNFKTQPVISTHLSFVFHLRCVLIWRLEQISDRWL